MAVAATPVSQQLSAVDYRTSPAVYRHWSLGFEGPVATLGMKVAEDGGIRSGYKLKLNSYDLGVDIEFADALNRIRFEHPEVGAVVVTSLRDRVFCSGANIFMLGLSSHAWKVNFCKFTNETRNGIEDSSRHSDLKFLAAINGNCAGGGYELALACDEIWLVDDRFERDLIARGSASRCAARNGRSHATHRQAEDAARSRRCVLYDRRGCTRRPREGLATGGRDHSAIAVRREGSRPSPRARRGEPPSRGIGRRRADAARADGRARSNRIRARHGRDRPRSTPRQVDRSRAAATRAEDHRRHRGRRRALVAAGHGSGARRRNPLSQDKRDRHWDLVASNRRRSAGRRRRRHDAGRPPESLARS